MTPQAALPDGPPTATPPARAFEVLAEKIRERVESGELKIGDRIPSEITLAKEEQVSRSTVREAIRTLEEAGVLERRSPKILVVRSNGEDVAFKEFSRALERRSVRFIDVHEAQLILEPALVRFATERATSRGIAAMQSILDAQAGLAGDPDRWHEASRRFRRHLAEMANNPALLIARASLSSLIQPALRLIYVTPEDLNRLHLLDAAIGAEVSAGDPEGAAYAARKSVLDFGRNWEEAGHTMDAMITRVSLEALGNGTAWGFDES